MIPARTTMRRSVHNSVCISELKLSPDKELLGVTTAKDDSAPRRIDASPALAATVVFKNIGLRREREHFRSTQL